MKDKRVVFMGTPEFSVPVLKRLIEETNVVLVVTQPDAPVGRKKILTPSPIKELALKNNIEVFTPNKIRSDYQKIIDTKPDIIITCAYGQIIPKNILDLPKHKCINVHASLLPKLRGGAPIHHAIIDGYDKTGITIMYMDEKMDTGDIISSNEIKIDDDMTTSILHDKLSVIGADLLIKTLPSIFNKTNNRIKQNNEDATYGYNITKEEEKINFNKTSKEIYNQIRGLNEYPGAYTTLDNKIIKVYSSRIGNGNKTNPGEIINIYKDGIGVSTSDGEIIITKLQMPGKKVLAVRDYLNGVDKSVLLGKKFM